MDFKASPLYGISNKKYLAELLRVDLYILKNISHYFSTKPFIAEINGKERILYNPSSEHKRVLKRINLLLQPIGAKNYVFGGIKKRSYIMNATIHKNNTFFCLIDLKNFFPSTKEKYVYNFYKNKLNMSTDIAKICTLLTTEKNPEKDERHLPQGYSTSPYLSYLSYFDLFEELNKISTSKNLTFSCYYDDLTFSSETFISKSVKRSIIKRINQYELFVNHGKSRLLQNKSGIKVTGAIIRDNKLLSPNRTQHKLYTKYDELIKLFYEAPFEKPHIIRLCNEVQGLSTAVQIVDSTKNLDYIKISVKEIRTITLLH